MLKISSKFRRNLYSIIIIILCIFSSISGAMAEEDSTGADILADLRSPFIQKMPAMMKKIEDVVHQVQQMISNEPQAVEDRKDEVSSFVPRQEEIPLWQQIEEDPVENEDEFDRFQKPMFVISGVLWNSQKPMAIVNGQVVAVGDYIDDVMVTNIQSSEVSFKDAKENIFVLTVDR